MLNLALLLILTLLAAISVKRLADHSVKGKVTDLEQLKKELEASLKEWARLREENYRLEALCSDIIALYDLTKDISRVFDEQAILMIFKERLARYMEVKDCVLLSTKTQLRRFNDYKILPLRIEKETIGYLAADGIKDGDLDKFNILGNQLLSAVKRAHLYKKLQELSTSDMLTQVFNRRFFMERLSEEMERSRKFGLKFSFAMIDIDHFKEFNDRYGHLVGDAILREVVKTIKENTRQVDFVGRYGGEEFSVVFTETDDSQCLFAAERIRKATEERKFKIYDEELKVTISLGVATFSQDASNLLTLIEEADQALYNAKKTGRNKVCSYGS